MKCCKCERETQETVSANHPGASVYCPDCGRCAGCGESVAYFIPVQELGIWLCPCVAAKRHEVVEVRKYEPTTPVVQEKKIIQFGDVVARTSRKRKTS